MIGTTSGHHLRSVHEIFVLGTHDMPAMDGQEVKRYTLCAALTAVDDDIAAVGGGGYSRIAGAAGASACDHHADLRPAPVGGQRECQSRRVNLRGIGMGSKRMRQSVVAALLPLVFSAVVSAAVGRGSNQDVPALITALRNQDKEIRRNAAQALGQIGPTAKEAVHALITALQDEDPNVRRLAASALGRIGPTAKEAVPALI
jgi:HEAT repeat protein